MNDEPSTVKSDGSGPRVARFLATLQGAATESGRPASEILEEIVALCMREQRLTPQEYFDLGAYRARDPRAFVGGRAGAALNGALNGALSQRAIVLANRLSTEFLLRGAGVPVVTSVAIVGDGDGGPLPNIARARDIAAFLAAEIAAGDALSNAPILFQRLAGMSAFRRAPAAYYVETMHGAHHGAPETPIDALEPSRLVSIAEPSAFEAVADEAKRAPLLLRQRLTTAPALRRALGAQPSSVYVVTLKAAGATTPLYAVWKLPQAPGAPPLLAELSLETGRIERAQSGVGLEAKTLERHPSTGVRLRGVSPPDWSDVLAVAVRASRCFPSWPLLGVEVVLAAAGPVVASATWRPDHRAAQLAAGEGLLRPAIARSFRAAMRARRPSAARSEPPGPGPVARSLDLADVGALSALLGASIQFAGL